MKLPGIYRHRYGVRNEAPVSAIDSRGKELMNRLYVTHASWSPVTPADNLELEAYNNQAYARAINPRVNAGTPWSWHVTTPGLLFHAVREQGWTFIPNQVLPPMLANVTYVSSTLTVDLY